MDRWWFEGSTWPQRRVHGGSNRRKGPGIRGRPGMEYGMFSTLQGSGIVEYQKGLHESRPLTSLSCVTLSEFLTSLSLTLTLCCHTRPLGLL